MSCQLDRFWPLGWSEFLLGRDYFHRSYRQAPPAGPLLPSLTSPLDLSELSGMPFGAPMAPLWLPCPLKTIDFLYVFRTFCEIQHLAKKSSKVSPSEPNGIQSCPQVTPMAPKVRPK